MRAHRRGALVIQWHPDPVLLELGPLKLRWYSLMFLIGFTYGYHVVKKMFIREGRPIASLDSLLVHIVLGTMIGARLGHCLFYDPGFYLSHPIEILKVWEGGLASHGGTLGVILALWLFCRKHPEFSFLWILDRISVPVAFVASLIRIGNLMNSEIIGKPTDLPWAFVFERVDPQHLPRHPAQLYESLSYMTCFFITSSIYRRNPSPPKGLLFGITIFWIFTWRIIWELVKENQEAFENGMLLNMGQLLSLPFILVSGWLIVRALRAKPDEAPAAVTGGKRKKSKR